MKKRLLIGLIIATTIFSTQTEKTIYASDDTTNDQTISDKHDVSFNLIQDTTCTQKSETDYSIDEIQMRTEIDRQLSELDQIDDTLRWFKKYKEIRNEFSSILKEEIHHAQINDVYTENEIYYIERMVETETHGCSFMAHVNVANVVFNRIKHKKFPNDPISVVTAGGQFCYGRTKISESVRLAVEYAFMFGDTTNGAIYFRSGARTNTFSGKPLVHEDDAVHYFYG